VVRDTVERPPGELGLSKAVEYYSFPLQFFLTVGNWATGGYPACKKAGCCFVGGDDFDWSFARLILAPVVVIISIILNCKNP